MVKDGVELLVEVGPGKVLSGLIRKIKKEARVYNIENTEMLKKFKNEAKDKKIMTDGNTAAATVAHATNDSPGPRRRRSRTT